MRECGGCQGQGAHWRWCPEEVGLAASRYGIMSQQAENLGDQVGANETGAANHLYRAAGLLRKKAEQAKYEWKEQP